MHHPAGSGRSDDQRRERPGGNATNVLRYRCPASRFFPYRIDIEWRRARPYRVIFAMKICTALGRKEAPDRAAYLHRQERLEIAPLSTGALCVPTHVLCQLAQADP